MRSMSWDALKYFIVTARAGSLTAAAATLKVSPATLSRRLAAFEQELGQLLFARAPSGYVLTQEGRALLAACGPVEAGFVAVAEAVQSREGAPSGTVRVAVPENIANLVLLPKLAEFARDFPQIALEFRSGIQPIALHSREADLAVRLSMPAAGAFKARHLGRMSHALYRAAGDVAGGDRDLGIIGWVEEYEALPIARAAMAHPDWRGPSLRMTTLQGHVAAARAGLGAAYLPCLVGDHCADLIRVDGPEGYLRQDIYLVLHDDLIETPRVRVVAEFLIRALRAAEGPLAGRP